MSLEKKVMDDLKLAMKAKDNNAKTALRAIKSAILLTKTDGTGNELDEAGEIKLIQKLIKQRQDSHDIYVKQGREDLAATEKAEIEVIQKFLPAQLSEEEVTAVVQEIVSSVGATSMKDMGKVMGMASAKLAGSADGKTISSIVKKILTNS